MRDTGAMTLAKTSAFAFASNLPKLLSPAWDMRTGAAGAVGEQVGEVGASANLPTVTVIYGTLSRNKLIFDHFLCRGKPVSDPFEDLEGVLLDLPDHPDERPDVFGMASVKSKPGKTDCTRRVPGSFAGKR